MTAEPGVQELRELVAEFEPGRGHVMPALHKIQDTYGYITRTAIEVVASQLNTTPAMIYGSVSFYSDFRTHAPAATEVAWCCGPACRVKGGDRIREVLQQEFDLPLNGQTQDHAIGLHIGQCNGTCSEAPQVWVNGEVVGNLTPAKAVRLARDLKAGQ